MTYCELKGWHAYFDRRPPDWRDDDRAAKLIQAQGSKAKPWEIFPSLRKVYDSLEDADAPKTGGTKGLANSFLGHLLLGAKGGDAVDLTGESSA